MRKNIPGKNNRKRRIYRSKIPELPCLCCGVCCSKYQPQLNSTEAHTLADNLGINWESFLADYIDSRWPGTQTYLLLQVNGTCIFLRSQVDQKQKLCSIHRIKPSCCLKWRQGLERPECLEGLKKVWDLTLDSAGNICGHRENIEAFKRFIQDRKNLT